MGAQHKRAAISGAAYRVDVIATLAPGKIGKLKLSISKDRHGAVRAVNATVAGIFVLDSTIDGQVDAHIEAPTQVEPGEPFRPTHLMEKVSRHLELAAEPPTKTELAGAVTGKKEYLYTAIDCLIREGWVEVDVAGKRHLHRSVKPYRDEENP